MFLLVSYDKDDLKYTWTKKVGSEIYIYDKEMAQFTVINATRQLKHPLYHSGGKYLIIDLHVVLSVPYYLLARANTIVSLSFHRKN